MSVIDVLETLAQRLPELEYRLDEIGKIQSAVLPKGLFKAGRFSETLSSSTCIGEVRTDLLHLKALLEEVHEERSPVVAYLTQQVSLKMQVLLQLCHQYRRKKITAARTNIEMKQLVTRDQWLNTVRQEHQRLLLQQSALKSALDKNQQNAHAVLTLQRALDDVKDQLVAVERTLSTLTGSA